MFDLVHRYISLIHFERTIFNDNPYYYKIDIQTHKGWITIYYNGRLKNVLQSFIEAKDGLLPFEFDQIIRTENGITTEKLNY